MILPPERPSPRRRRTEKTAMELIDHELHLSHARRQKCLQRISKAPQPKAEAKRIIDQHRKDMVRGLCPVEGEVDLSDAQVLRVKLIRRDKGVWLPQSTMLGKMERQIVTEGMTKAEFQDAAEALLAIPQALPKKFRETEWELSRQADSLMKY